MKEGVEKEIIKIMKRKIRKPLYQVSDKYAKPVISLFLIQNDLKEIKNCLTKLAVFSDEDGLLVKSLWKNAIITYGKIFSKSADGYSSLEKSDCISEKYYHIHDELIKLRNSFIAHRGENEFENSMLLTYEKKKNGYVGFEFTIPTAIRMGHLMDDIEKMKDLISELETIVEERLNKKLKGIDSLLWKEIELNKTSS